MSARRLFVLKTRPTAGSLKMVSCDVYFVAFAVVWTTEAEAIKRGSPPYDSPTGLQSPHGC